MCGGERPASRMRFPVGPVRRTHGRVVGCHATGPRPTGSDLAGILAFESEWNPPLGKSLVNALESGMGDGRLEIGCVAAHGLFTLPEEGTYAVPEQGKPATAFLLELIARLQASATVP